jgi:WD40 repeat protein/serine/threonine protein kinase
MNAAQHIKGYEIGDRIGAGGFGAVYRATQSTVGREVAIKVVLPGLANQPEFIRRFESEAQIVARLEHPHITPLYDYWRDSDGAYLVMRYLRGGSLRHALDTGTFEPRAAALMLDQIAGALSLAHRSGVIHRDIKPGNILLDEDGNAYLTDFGIAKDLHLKGANTNPDAIIGSLDYISPEQARSEPITPRTDIYSLGVTLYETIAGQHPFPNISGVERLYKHINDPLPQITTLDASISAGVNRVIHKATAKNPDDRYADALAFAADFREAIGMNRVPTDITELLTPREHEILALIIAGDSNKEIAHRLTVTLSTVKWYVNQIYSKLGVRSRVQAMVRARELNLLVIGKSGGSAADPQTVRMATEDFNPVNPYKGLLAFQSADYQEFFGREKLTAALIKKIGETGEYSRFTAIVGPSGSGKSSLVKAGVIPALWRGDLKGAEKWYIAEMTPGSRPLDELEIALTRVAAQHAADLHDHLHRDPYGLLRAAGLILPNDGSDLLLVIDQFEEAFTLCDDDDARAHFLDLIVAAVTEPRSRVRVVITLRADYYDRPLHDPHFGELMRHRLETILPLSAEELERAIVKPAERVGVSFEAGLVSSIVADVKYQPGALPLLQYALTELFDGRSGRMITHDIYQAIGGTAGALAKRAEALYSDLPADQREAARQMFLRLVTLGEGAEDTRRRALRSELMGLSPDLMDEVIDTFADYRLLALDNDPISHAPTVEAAHEALLREWERLREWINANREEIHMEQQLAHLTDEWVGANRDASYLVGGLRLQQFETWAGGATMALTPDERAYLDASVARRKAENQAETEREQRENRLERRSRAFLIGLVAVLLLATLGAFSLTGAAVTSANAARENEILAVSARDESEANFSRAERIRLASQAQVLLGNRSSGELPALLALQSLRYGYSPQADVALIGGLTHGFTERQFSHPSLVTDAVFSPDQSMLLTSSMDAIARLWDVSNGELIREFDSDHALMWNVAFSPDGQTIATGDVTRAVILWDANTGAALHTFQTPMDAGGVSFSEDGSLLMSINRFAFGGDMTVLLWDAQTYDVTQRIFVPNGSWAALSSDNGTIYTVTHSGELGAWDVATGESRYSLQDDGFDWSSVAASPDGQWLATSGADGVIMIRDAATGEIVRPLAQAGALVGNIAFSPDSQSLASVQDDGLVRLWDVETGNLIHDYIGHTDTVFAVSFSPDGRNIVTASADASARVWQAIPDVEPQVFRIGSAGEQSSVAFAPQGETLFASAAGNTVRAWNVETGEFLGSFSGSTFLDNLNLSGDGRYLAGNSATNGVYVWDVQSNETILDSTGLIGRLSPDGSQFAVGMDVGSIRLYDVQLGGFADTLIGHTAPATGLSYNDDGAILVSGSQDGTVRFWNTETAEEIRQISPHNGDAVLDLALSPDGRYVATAGADHTAALWDVATGEQIRQFIGHTGVLNSINFSADGSLLATTSADLTTRIWDVETGEEIRHLEEHTSQPTDAAFSADGRYLATSGNDGTVRLWRVNFDDVVALACDQLPRDFTPLERETYLLAGDSPTCPA